MHARSLVSLALLAALTSLAHADIVSVTGTTAGGSTFTRPLEDLSGLSAIGVGVSYRTLAFDVSVSGDYTFASTALFDNFSLLYSGAFSPLSPLTSALAASDDLIAPPFTTSGFAASLTAGTSYVFLTTGFSAADAGAFSNTIGGPGTINVTSAPTPESSRITTFAGSTSGGPTFNRPLEDLSGLSAIGVAVPYSSFAFRVTSTGDYTFLNTAAFDNFALLYQGSFNPASPLANAIGADDDLLAAPFTTAGFAASLTAGVDYVLVSTGFGASDFGAFSETIGGPGQVVSLNPVPEPETYALLLAGLGLMSWAARRRTASRGA